MRHDSDKEPSDWQVSILTLAIPILIGFVVVPVLDFACQPRQPQLPTQEEMDRTIRRTDEFLEEQRQAREAEKRARKAEKTKIEKAEKE